MNTIWILTIGEDYGTNYVRGVYDNQAAAFGDLHTEAIALQQRCGLDTAFQTPDGTVYLHGGRDRIELRPYNTIRTPAVVDAVTAVSQLISGVAR